jgi:hypothetical protein
VVDQVVYPRSAKEESVSLERLRAELLWMGETTRARLRDRKPNLFLMDYTMADEAGHRWGAASPEYRAATAAVDDEVRKLASEVDFQRTVLLVTSDHGHTPAGGHGGPEPDVTAVPLVMVGGPVRARTRGECEQVDVAPTVAALLGVAVPASNQGAPLLDFLDVALEQRQAVLRALYEQRSHFVAHYLSRVTGQPETAARADIPPASPEPALARLAGLAEAAKRERMAGEAGRRLFVPVAAVAGIVLAALALRAAAILPAPGLALSVLGGLGAAALYFFLLRLARVQYSFSAVNRDEALDRFFATDMVLAVSACALVTALSAGWFARRPGGVGRGDLARLAFLVTAAFGALLVLKMALAYWRHGIFLRWQMPDQFWAFGFYLDTLAVVALGVSAPAMPLFAWAGGALTGAFRRP